MRRVTGAAWPVQKDGRDEYKLIPRWRLNSPGSFSDSKTTGLRALSRRKCVGGWDVTFSGRLRRFRRENSSPWRLWGLLGLASTKSVTSESLSGIPLRETCYSVAFPPSAVYCPILKSCIGPCRVTWKQGRHFPPGSTHRSRLREGAPPQLLHRGTLKPTKAALGVKDPGFPSRLFTWFGGLMVI